MSDLPLPQCLMAFGLSFIILTAFLKTGAARHLAMDVPNQRSLHSIAIPRVGGIAIVIAAMSTWAVLPGFPIVLMLLIAMLAVISYIDDKRGLSAGIRFACHIAAAIASALFFLGDHDALVATGLILCIIWSTNTFNFMDGSDGLAGGMALVGFTSYALAFNLAHAELFEATSLILAASSAAFLLFNFPPARIFMGDAGSISLGFLSAVLGIAGWELDAWPHWFPILVFSPFLADATVTLLRRMLRGERFWEAHREHYYQRLIRMGWSHRRTALCEYAIMAGVSLTALAGLHLEPAGQALILTGWAITFAAMMWIIDRRWQRFQDSGETNS